MVQMVLCTDHQVWHGQEVACPVCDGTWDLEATRRLRQRPRTKPGASCGAFAPHGLTVDGKQVKCWKHYKRHCVAKRQIHFRAGVLDSVPARNRGAQDGGSVSPDAGDRPETVDYGQEAR